MANINLGKTFSKQQNKISAVDSNLQLNRLGKEHKAIYSDLLLDLDYNFYRRNELNALYSSHDLKNVIDEEAVITSVRNIFNTAKYTRLLNPDVSFDLRGFLFEPLTEAKAYFMAYTLLNVLPTLEPRIRVDNVVVGVNIQDSFYDIKLTISIPSLSTTISLGGILNSDGYFLYD